MSAHHPNARAEHHVIEVWEAAPCSGADQPRYRRIALERVADTEWIEDGEALLLHLDPYYDQAEEAASERIHFSRVRCLTRTQSSRAQRSHFDVQTQSVVYRFTYNADQAGQCELISDLQVRCVERIRRNATARGAQPEHQRVETWHSATCRCNDTSPAVDRQWADLCRAEWHGLGEEAVLSLCHCIADGEPQHEQDIPVSSICCLREAWSGNKPATIRLGSPDPQLVLSLSYDRSSVRQRNWVWYVRHEVVLWLTGCQYPHLPQMPPLDPEGYGTWVRDHFEWDK
jgi:hypothetical protein